MTETQASTNFEYLKEEKRPPKKFFVGYANSYHGKKIVAALTRASNENFDCALYGTLKRESNLQCMPNVEFLNPQSENFLPVVTQCDVIICDISLDFTQIDETKKIIKALERKLKSGEKLNSRLILISTIMTWAETTMQKNSVMSDFHFRKRRPHACFHEHLLLERSVVNMQRKFPKTIKSTVLCPGIIYGEEQDIFEYMYKRSYCNSLEIEIFEPGTNFLPLVYVHDFVKIIAKIIDDDYDDEHHYILAVQGGPPLSAIEIARIFTKGTETPIRICERCEMFDMCADINQRVFNHLTLDLCLESQVLTECDFELNGDNLSSYTERLSSEFYASRRLKPLKILIDGSPFTPQKELSKMLSDHYGVHQIDMESALDNMICRLNGKIRHSEDYLRKMEKFNPHEEKHVITVMIDEVKNRVDLWKNKLSNVELLLKSDNESTFDTVKDNIREMLHSRAFSKNQGFVMSGFQLERDSASFLFDERTMPNTVIIINNEVVKRFRRECSQAEEMNDKNFDTQKTDDEHVEMQKIVENYYDSQYDDTVLENYFLEQGIVPIEFTINENDENLKEVFEKIKSEIGTPQTYYASTEEKEKIDIIKKEIKQKEDVEMKLTEEKRREMEKNEREKRREEINNLLRERKRKELIEIEKRSIPVRQYLLKFVFPNMVDAIAEVAKSRPPNPVQFLSDFLLQKDQSYDSNGADFNEEVAEEFKSLSECD